MHTTAQHPRPRRRIKNVTAALSAAALALALPLAGCKNEVKQGNPEIKVRHADLPNKPDVPTYMKGTIWEATNRMNDEPYAVASYALVGRLRGTGDSTAALPVRQWMIKQMA